MKLYHFTMRDEDTDEISYGHVVGEDWQSAWFKLCTLIRAGYKILDVDEVLEVGGVPIFVGDDGEMESAIMAELKLIKKGDGDTVPPALDRKYKITFLVGDNQIDIITTQEIAEEVHGWFHDPDQEIPTIDLFMGDTAISLDRGFVGALLMVELKEEDDAACTKDTE